MAQVEVKDGAEYSPARIQCLTRMHFSTQRKQFSWDTLRGFSDKNGSG